MHCLCSISSTLKKMFQAHDEKLEWARKRAINDHNMMAHFFRNNVLSTSLYWARVSAVFITTPKPTSCGIYNREATREEKPRSTASHNSRLNERKMMIPFMWEVNNKRGRNWYVLVFYWVTFFHFSSRNQARLITETSTEGLQNGLLIIFCLLQFINVQ